MTKFFLDMKQGSLDNFSLFCWNIGNPSKERAKKQAVWLDNRPEHIFVLTETKKSDGCLLIEEYFKTRDYDVIFPKPEGKECGTMIISKYSLMPSDFSNRINYLQSRIVSAKLKLPDCLLEIIGVYVPSRNSEYEKIIRKKRFLENLTNTLKKDFQPDKRVFCGDLNILEPNHIPRYPFFQKWEYNFYENLIKNGFEDAFRYLNPDAQEYSWVGHAGDGYRYDHCFVSENLLSLVQKSHYFSEPRETRLSDHSALITEFDFQLAGAKPRKSPALF